MSQHIDIPITNVSASEPRYGREAYVSVCFDGHTGNINVTGFCMYASMTTEQVDMLIAELRQAQADRINYKGV